MAAAKKQAEKAPKARVLKTSVHVHEWVDVPDSPYGERRVARTEVFNAGDELPKWAQSQVGEHVYEDSSSDGSNA